MWPYAASQTLTGLANLLIDYPPQPYVTNNDYFAVLSAYAFAQQKNGQPYVAEAHDPDNPVWIYDSFNHSEDYNHSTFNDLVLSGLLGIRPQLTDMVIVHPLPDSWSYFANRESAVSWPKPDSALGPRWITLSSRGRTKDLYRRTADGGAQPIAAGASSSFA